MLYRLVSRRTGNDLRIAVTGVPAGAGLLVLQPQFGAAGLLVLVPVVALLVGQARIAARSLLMAAVDESATGRAFGLVNAWGLAATAVVMAGTAEVTGHWDSRYGFAVLAAVSATAAVLAAVQPGVEAGKVAPPVRGEVEVRRYLEPLAEHLGRQDLVHPVGARRLPAAGHRGPGRKRRPPATG